jgi:hypothetical protein
MPKGCKRRLAPALLLCWAAASPVAAAETTSDAAHSIQRALEIAAHRRLMAAMDSVERRPSPFVSDGCSGGLSMAWEVLSDLFPAFAATHEEHPPWEDCCVAHDQHYHNAAGAETAEQGYQARLSADEQLRTCVVDTGVRRTEALAKRYGLTEAQVSRAYSAVAEAMYDAVRFGGGPCSGLPWRWGYGYPGCLWGQW